MASLGPTTKAPKNFLEEHKEVCVQNKIADKKTQVAAGRLLAHGHFNSVFGFFNRQENPNWIGQRMALDLESDDSLSDLGSEFEGWGGADDAMKLVSESGSDSSESD